jgi:large subunit ribosomal protein L11
MAKKITGVTRLQIPAGTAADGPFVRRLLGPKGVNAAAFSSAFDAATADDGRRLIPVVITTYEDKSFSFVINEACTGPAHSTFRHPADAL